MMKDLTFAWLLMSSMTQGGAPGDSPGALRVTFDDGLTSAAGVAPTQAEGVESVPGRTGRAAKLGGVARLAYPTEGSYDPRRGTVDLWVCPDWNSDEVNGDKILWAVGSDPEQNNRTALGCFGKGQSAIVYFSNDGGVDAVVAPIAWRKGEWHHVVACWDESVRCRGLCVDGRLHGPVRYGRNMPARQREFYVGHVPDASGPRYEADAAIDDLLVSGQVDAEDFLRSSVVKSARERAKYEAAFERLGREYSLDRVAREHREVSWKDLQGGATPLSQLVRVQERYHPSHVYVQPDLSIALDLRIGLGFAVGSPAKLPDFDDVTRKLLDGYLPIVESRWHSGDLTVDQTAFAFLPHDDEVVSGRETQFAVVRMGLTNRSDSPHTTSLLAVVCPKLEGTQTMMYASYKAPATRWRQDPATIKYADGVLQMDGKILLTCRYGEGIGPSYHQTLPNAESGELQPDRFTNCLRFQIDMGPKQTRTIDFVLAGTSGLQPPGDLDAMRATTFDLALARALRHWEEALKPSMKLVTPDRRANDVYRHALLSSLQFMIKVPDRPWRAPYQTPSVIDMVWPWEAATMLVPMISAGYHRQCDPSMSYFTERQIHVGAFSENEAPGCYGEPARPAGDLESYKGAYIGFNPYWMNETGSVLWLLSERYRYTHDKDWLERNRPSILAAWEFIQNARRQTTVLDDKGEKVRYHGLLPRGRSHDWPGRRYHITFSDAFTWLGMSETAKAFTEAGLPEAGRMAADVVDYRKCILDVIGREQSTDPETGQVFVPSSVFYRDGGENVTGVWNLDGPMWLFYVGLLDASDKRFDDMEAYVDRTYGRLLGICGRMGPGSEFWYVNQSDDCYYNVYLARGQHEKALLVFHSALAYGLSNDTYQAVERIDAGDPNYCPLQPNASGNGRYIEMMRRMVIDEQDADKGILWLLRGCPRQWFAEGQSVVVEGAPTLFGEMSLRVSSNGNETAVDITCPDRRPPGEMRLALRHPRHMSPKSVTVNGVGVACKDEMVSIKNGSGRINVRCAY
jgi:hypothetical protein